MFVRGILAALALGLGEASAVEIIAHRGASFDAPENTLAAFRLAFEQGADAAECDIYLTKDGKIAVLHDKDTKRVAGLDKTVVDQTLDELRALDVGKWKAEKFAGEKIPTLTELLAIIPKGKRLYIEVKCGPEIMPELKRVLGEAKLDPDQTPIISFSAAVVAAAKKELPALKAYWIVSVTSKKKTWTVDELIRKGAEIKADGLDLSADPMITGDFVKKAEAARLPVFVWTVNDAAVAKRMVEAGVKAITTDRPGWLREQLAK
jgi:glycerophosphoryl diester phosphodiesterase